MALTYEQMDTPRKVYEVIKHGFTKGDPLPSFRCCDVKHQLAFLEQVEENKEKWIRDKTVIRILNRFARNGLLQRTGNHRDLRYKWKRVNENEVDVVSLLYRDRTRPKRMIVGNEIKIVGRIEQVPVAAIELPAVVQSEQVVA